MRFSSDFDLGIEGGTIVGSRSSFRANLYLSKGRVAAVSNRTLTSRAVIDVSGALVMPGMVDAHVHLMDPGDTSREDFPSGSSAAAVAGVTSLLEHTHSLPVRDVDELNSKISYLQGRSHVDFGLGAHVWEGDQDLDALWRAGTSFFKVFTCTTHGIPGWSYGKLRTLFSKLARLGAPCLVHSEDESITRTAELKLRSDGRFDGGVIPEWRGPEAERVAIAAVVQLADETMAKVILAHVSSADAVRLAGRLRRPGSKVVVESCPQYMELLGDEVARYGSFRKFTPPARARATSDLLAMWRLLADGEIDYVATDHAPSTSSQKSQGDIWSAPFGLPGLDTTMPILLTAAALHRMSYQRLVQVYSEQPARAYRLFPRKGSLRPGADADVLIVDPGRRWVLTDRDIRSKAGWSPYSGRHLIGKVVKTFVRGKLVADEGSIVDETAREGRFLGSSQSSAR